MDSESYQRHAQSAARRGSTISLRTVPATSTSQKKNNAMPFALALAAICLGAVPLMAQKVFDRGELHRRCQQSLCHALMFVMGVNDGIFIGSETGSSERVRA